MTSSTLNDSNKEPLVIIEWDSDNFSLYNESGQAIEHDFNSRTEAKQWAVDNNYNIVDTFLNTQKR